MARGLTTAFGATVAEGTQRFIAGPMVVDQMLREVWVQWSAIAVGNFTINLFSVPGDGLTAANADAGVDLIQRRIGAGLGPGFVTFSVGAGANGTVVVPVGVRVAMATRYVQLTVLATGGGQDVSGLFCLFVD